MRRLVRRWVEKVGDAMADAIIFALFFLGAGLCWLREMWDNWRDG